MQIDTVSLLDTPVDKLNLLVRHQMVLREKGLGTIGAILASDFDLLSLRRWRVHRNEVNTAVAEYIGKMVLADLNPRYKENSDA
jgi:hypothetical protein